MTCDEARELLLDAQREHLPADRRGALESHLASCEACAHEAAAESLLSEALEGRLPQHAAPLGLKRRLAAAWPGGPAAAPAPRWWASWRRALVPALAVSVLLLVAVPLYYQRAGGPGAPMVTEAVNDHLRLLSSQHPLDIESGGMHQVKPWFEGRLDFAPVVRFLGDDDFPLRGGAVGYYLDR
jgi:anti-sigma factor RsiW